MKKRRTRAQIAATKKLVAFNKKRRGKKTVKKKGRKKRRTTKQIAATRKLVALNKRRRKNPRKKSTWTTKTRKYIVKKKRTTKAKSHLRVVFKCRGQTVHFLGLKSGALSGWKSHKGEAVLFPTIKQAQSAAVKIATRAMATQNWNIGVAPSDMTKAQIAAQCGVSIGRSARKA